MRKLPRLRPTTSKCAKFSAPPELENPQGIATEKFCNVGRQILRFQCDLAGCAAHTDRERGGARPARAAKNRPPN